MPDRTFELLQQMVVQGYSKADQLKGDADFVSLHGDPRFIALLSRLEAPAAYAALWRADVEYESKLLGSVPSEAEWEYACRAGTTTARYFGETETLLGEYAWYTKTSGDKWMLPVCSLRPNGFGLFDMQGNVMEWCQDAALLYDTDLARMGDKEQAGKLSNSQSRVLRGGSFNDVAPFVRSANRYLVPPEYRYSLTFGFRASRTYR